MHAHNYVRRQVEATATAMKALLRWSATKKKYISYNVFACERPNNKVQTFGALTCKRDLTMERSIMFPSKNLK